MTMHVKPVVPATTNQMQNSPKTMTNTIRLLCAQFVDSHQPQDRKYLIRMHIQMCLTQSMQKRLSHSSVTVRVLIKNLFLTSS